MALTRSIFMVFLVSLLLAGTAFGQWVVVEDFEGDLPLWDTTRDGGGNPWDLSADPDVLGNRVLNHELIQDAGLPGISYIVCKTYAVTPNVTGEIKIRNKGAIANGYGTMACIVREGVHTADEAYTDYSADGVFNSWKVVAHSRENPHTVGTWDSTWHESPSVLVDTGAGEQAVTVGFVAAAAFGTTPEGWFDDLQFSESLLAPGTGVEFWEIYR